MTKMNKNSAKSLKIGNKNEDKKPAQPNLSKKAAKPASGINIRSKRIKKIENGST